jgi:hypothetical protein
LGSVFVCLDISTKNGFGRPSWLTIKANDRLAWHAIAVARVFVYS